MKKHSHHFSAGDYVRVESAHVRDAVFEIVYFEVEDGNVACCTPHPKRLSKHMQVNPSFQYSFHTQQLTLVCANCFRPKADHVKGHCLFGTTLWER